MRAGFPDFRLGKVLATSFTATLTERHGNAVERIPTPHRLVDWLAVNGLAVDSCTTAQLDLARELRESIHVAATAAAIQNALPASAVQVINDCSAQLDFLRGRCPQRDRRRRDQHHRGRTRRKIGLVCITNLPSRLLRHQPKSHPQMV